VFPHLLDRFEQVRAEHLVQAQRIGLAVQLDGLLHHPER